MRFGSHWGPCVSSRMTEKRRYPPWEQNRNWLSMDNSTPCINQQPSDAVMGTSFLLRQTIATPLTSHSVRCAHCLFDHNLWSSTWYPFSLDLKPRKLNNVIIIVMKIKTYLWIGFLKFPVACVIATVYYSQRVAPDISTVPGWKDVTGFFEFSGIVVRIILKQYS